MNTEHVKARYAVKIMKLKNMKKISISKGC